MRRNAVRKYNKPSRGGNLRQQPFKSSLSGQRRQQVVRKRQRPKGPSLIKRVFVALITLVLGIFGLIISAFRGLGASIRSFFLALANSFTAAVQSVVAFCRKVFVGVGTKSTVAFSSTAKGMNTASSRALSASTEAFQGSSKFVASIGTSVWSALRIVVGNALHAVIWFLLFPFKFPAVRMSLMAVAIVALGTVVYLHRINVAPKTAMQFEVWPGQDPEVALFDADLPLLRSSSITHSVRRGDTLASIAMRYGFRDKDVAGLNEAVKQLNKKEASHQNLQLGQDVELVLGDDGFSGIRIPSSKAVMMVIERNANGAFESRLEKQEVEHRERVASGVIASSFAAAADKTGVSYDIVDDLVDLFSDRVNFHQDFQVGDRFVIIYRDQVLESGESVGTDAILAAALYIKGKRLVATRYVGGDGKARYFDEKQQYIGNGFLRYPLKFTRISSYFSTSRFHPVLKTRKPHNGVDFAAPVGTPVRSVATGKVTLAGWNGPAGIMVKISHNERYSSAYLHLSKLAPGIKRGATVTRGQVIGAVGTTGRSTGPHLHYSFYDRGRYLDPLKTTLPTIDTLTSGMRIDKTYLNRVLYTLQQYEQTSSSN